MVWIINLQTANVLTIPFDPMDSFKVTGRLDMVHYTPRDENIALVNSFFDQKALESLGNLDSLITVNALGANIRHGISYTRDMDELNWPFVVKWTDSYEPYIVPCINEQHHTMVLFPPLFFSYTGSFC